MNYIHSGLEQEQHDFFLIKESFRNTRSKVSIGVCKPDVTIFASRE